MTSGQRWEQKGRLSFYVMPDNLLYLSQECLEEAQELMRGIDKYKVCVSDGWQTFSIVPKNGHLKTHVPQLIKDIMESNTLTWYELEELIREHDEYGDTTRTLFEYVSIRREWIK